LSEEVQTGSSDYLIIHHRIMLIAKAYNHERGQTSERRSTERHSITQRQQYSSASTQRRYN
jgi:hypothetical protein